LLLVIHYLLFVTRILLLTIGSPSFMIKIIIKLGKKSAVLMIQDRQLEINNQKNFINKN